MPIMEYFMFAFGIIGGTWLVFHSLRLLILGGLTIVYGKRTVPVSQTPLQPTTSILVTGDSTAYGVGALDPRNSLAGRLAQDLPRALIKNASQNAINSQTLYELLRPIPSQSYDYLMIHIGGIDTISCRSEARINRSLDHALTEATRIAVKKVFVVSVNNAGLVPFFPFPLNRFFSWRSRHVSAITARSCERHNCIHIPLYAELAKDELSQQPKRYISPDQTHPNDAGYGLWYKKIRAVILPHITAPL